MKPNPMNGFTTLCRLLKKRWLIALSPMVVLLVMVGLANTTLLEEYPLDDAPPPEATTAQATVEALPVSVDARDPEHPRLLTQNDTERLHAFTALLNAEDVRQKIYHAYQHALKEKGKTEPLPLQRINIQFAQDRHHKNRLHCVVQTQQTPADIHALTLATQALNELRHRYQEWMSGAILADGSFNEEAAKEHLKQTEAELNQTIREIEAYKAAHQIVDFPVQKTTARELTLLYRTLLNQTKSNQSQLKAKYRALLSQLKQPAFSPEAFRQRLATDEILSRLQQQWISQTLLLERLQATLPPNDPKIKDAQAMVSALQDTFEQRLAEAPSHDKNHASGIQPVRLPSAIPPKGSTTGESGIIPAVDKPASLTGSLENKTYKPLSPSEVQLMGALADTDIALKGNQTKISGLSGALARQEKARQKLSAAESTLLNLQEHQAHLEEEYDHWSEALDRRELVAGLLEHNQIEVVEAPHLLKKERPFTPTHNPIEEEGLLNDPLWVSLLMLVALGLGLGGALIQEKLSGESIPDSPPPKKAPEKKAGPGPGSGSSLFGKKPVKKRPEADSAAAKVPKEAAVRTGTDEPASRITVDLSCLEAPAEFLARMNLPQGPVAQAFQTLVKQLNLPATDSSFKVQRIAVSGNSLMAAGLATALAQQGAKTCLVEISEDSALLGYLFHLDQPLGLSEVLSNQMVLEDLITNALDDSPIPRLTILPRGDEAIPLAKQNKRWEELALTLVKRYERIIFCLPDIATNPEALKLMKALQPQQLLWVDDQAIDDKTWEKRQAEVLKLAPQCKIHRIL